jgi:hypothetical protein
VESLSPPPVRRQGGWFAGWKGAAAVAAAIILICTPSVFFREHPAIGNEAPKLVWMEVLESNHSGGETPVHLATGAKLAVKSLQMPAGFFRFKLDSGAVVSVNGPADLWLENAMHLKVKLGKVTTDVGENAKGFVVETAQTRVVDLGTRFGVDVRPSGHTDVVVFEGEVELYGGKQASGSSRLVEGEAVRVQSDRSLSRISSITSGPMGDDEWSTPGGGDNGMMIRAVRDNLHHPKSNFYYRVLRGGMREDAQAFIAKRHEWNGIDRAGMPAWLLDADLVQTYADGDSNRNIEITLDIARPGEIYVMIDSRSAPPGWLKAEFENTGEMIHLENAPGLETGIPLGKGPGNGRFRAPFAIWKKQVFSAGPLVLGPPPVPTGDNYYWMYGIAARPLK